MVRKIILGILLFAFVLAPVLPERKAHALCKGSFFNLITETGWVNLFPLKIGGITIVDSDQPDAPDAVSSPICVCADGLRVRIGISVSFWEPYRIIDSVFDPGCFPEFGLNLGSVVASGHLHGDVTHEKGKSGSNYFASQTHLVISPLLSILDLFKDVTCKDNRHHDFDIAYMTELDPLWQDDISSLVLNPEALVFANPITGLACIADSMTSAFGYPRDELFWCMGTWHDSTYPFTKNSDHATIPEGHAAAAGRLLYKLHREMLVGDRAIDACGTVYTPIWVKSHWRFQPLRPKAMTSGAARIGQLPETWAYKTHLFNPSVKGAENWSFLIWRKISCCVGWEPH